MPKTETFDRQEVIASATDLFQKKGYNGTSIGDLVEVTKLSRSSIYNSFDSKLNFFLEVLNAYSRNYGGLFTEAINKATDSKMAIQNIFDLHLNIMVEDKTSSGCLFVNTKAEMWNEDEIIGKNLKKGQNGLYKLFLNLIVKGKDDNSITAKTDSNEIALYLVTALHGFRLTGISHQNKSDLKKIKKMILKCLE